MHEVMFRESENSDNWHCLLCKHIADSREEGWAHLLYKHTISPRYLKPYGSYFFDATPGPKRLREGGLV